MFVPFDLDPEWRITEEYRDREWTLILRGNPEIALRDLDATHYWAGELVLPLSVRSNLGHFFSEPVSPRQ